jgi:hypothetical protein
VRLTLEFYDTLRLYQQRLDPAAYFRNVWLFPYQQNRERGIVTNWTRWPRYPHNQLIERQLESAGQDLLDGNYDRVEAKLAIVQAVLPGIPGLIELPYQPAFAPLIRPNKKPSLPIKIGREGWFARYCYIRDITPARTC